MGIVGITSETWDAAIFLKDGCNRVFELLERIGLPDVAPAMPYELSGGEAQRISVARAIAHYPKMLLADEPTANLDSDTGLNLIELMLSLGRNQCCTIIISTHDTDLIKLSDNTLNLLDGRGQKKTNEFFLSFP